MDLFRVSLILGLGLGRNIFLLCNIVLIIGAELPESGLCIPPSNISKPVSCAHQLWDSSALGIGLGQNESTCSLFIGLPSYAPSNTAECNAVTFGHKIGAAPDVFGIVKLKTYYYVEKSAWRQAAFNVTFSNITWTNLLMRFKEHGGNQSMCRHVVISSDKPVPLGNKLFYDCLWSYQQYESMPYFFEYTASNGNNGANVATGKYLFFVPNGTEINPENRYLNTFKHFVYMDLSEWPILKLRLQIPQEPFMNISSDHIIHYNVILHHNTSIWGHRSIKLGLTRSDPEELTFAYDTGDEGGDYYFTAQIEHEDCKLYREGCLISRTPRYAVTDDNLRLLIGIVGCGGALLSICVFVYFLWRWSLKYKNGDLPTVLIIYAPTTDAHIRCAVEFAKFLQNACHVNALLDVLEIPKTKTQDPFTWCNDAFLHSDFVMVLTSPYHQCNNHEGIYRNVDVLGMRNLKEKLGDRKSKQKFFTVILPYCTEKDIPSEVKNLKRFVLLKDLDKMLSFLHSSTFQRRSELEDDGLAFLEALSRAEAEVDSARKCICSNAGKPSLDELNTFDLTPSKDSSEDMLLPQREKCAPETLNMYPGPLDDLNLLGDDGIEVSSTTSQSRPTKQLVIDLNDLNLG